MRLRGSRPWVALAAVGACLGLARSAECQSRAGGWALDRFEPSAAGDRFFGAQYPEYRDLGVRFGVIGDYAYQPLVVRQGDAVDSVIDHMLVLHAQAGVSVLGRIGVDLSMPFTLLEIGPSNSGAGNGTGVSASNSAALGDLRVGARVRVFGDSRLDPISLHVGGQLYFGVFYGDGDRANNSTDASLRGRVWLNAAGTIAGVFHWSLEGGFHGRPTTDNVGTQVGSDVYARVALGFDVTDALTIAPEFWSSVVLDSQYGFNAEAVLGIHYRIANTVTVGLGGGPGLTHGAGTPVFRGLFQLAYAPDEAKRESIARPTDTDSDGVLDPEDQCLTVPQGPHPDPHRAGCPVSDRDGDGVLDTDDRCVDVPAGANPDPTRVGCPDGDDDNDGVLNADDECRTEHRSDHPDPRRNGCPDHDRDGDGVYDAADQCVDVPAGVHPDAARAGCPAPDRDGDTVPDPTDHCPEQPGIPTSNPETNGCPTRQLVVEHGVLRLLSPVYFATNSDRILSRSFPVLTAVAQVFHDATDITHVVIEGHTDDVGDDARNLELSQRRANSVLQWLTQNGIAAGRLQAQGFGETRPIVATAGLHGRRLRDARGSNRRVEFRIQDQAGSNPGSTAPAPAAAPAPAPAQ